MPTQLSTFFDFAGDPSSDAQFFYNTIQNETNSLGCHVTLFRLFAQALMLNSYCDRGAVPPYAKTMITDKPTLDKILLYIPAGPKEPLWQVLFEQFSIANGPGNNYMQVLTNSANTDLQGSVTEVTISEYTAIFNEVRQPYTESTWPNTAPSMPDSPSLSQMQSAFSDLATWIVANDQRLVFLNRQLALGVDAIIQDVFSSSQASINTFLFAETLLAQIRINGNSSKVETPQGSLAKAGNAFLRTVQVVVGDSTSIWQTSILKSFADPIASLNAASVNNNSDSLFEETRELFKAGLSNDDPTLVTQTKNAIVALFNRFSSNGPNASDFLLRRTLKTCNILMGSLNEDPSALLEWAEEIGEPIPDYICSQDIEDLMHAACSALSTIDLKPSNNYPNNAFTNVRLFDFSDFNVIGENDTVVHYPYRKEPLDTDTIIVTNDASENSDDGMISFYRPTFAIVYDASGDAGVKFFNVSIPLGDGQFYFTDTESPSRVLTIQQGTSNNLQFDFKTASINGQASLPVVVPGLSYNVGTPYKTTDANGSSLKVFYDVIRVVSKWHDLSGRSTYDVLYETASGSAIPDAHLVWRLPPGGGLSRADSVDDSLVLWEWLGPSGSLYSRVGEFLNLPKSRQIVRKGLANTMITIDGVNYTIQEIPGQADSFSYTVRDTPIQIDGIHYKFIRLTRISDGTTEDYVLTNTPNPNFSAAIDQALNRTAKSNQVTGDAATILAIMNFAYYRKVDDAVAANPKVIKWIPKNGNPQRPVIADSIEINKTVDYTVIGISLPVSFRILQNVALFKQLTNADTGIMGASLKNKESALYRETGGRLNAGTVMKGLIPFLVTPPTVKSQLPATLFGNWAMGMSDMARTTWQTLKDTNRSILPTNQEWCHIKGHGDGGDERLGNFVGGSFHCNSEQLAIESGQRQTTQFFPINTFKLLSTAYLFRNEDGIMKQGQNYLQNDTAYENTVNVHSALRIRTGKQPSKNSSAGTNIPFVAFFRYKVEKNMGNDNRQKVFEHVFEGQSEFIDVHQFNILSKTAQFTLAGADIFIQWYNEMKDATDTAKANTMKD